MFGNQFGEGIPDDLSLPEHLGLDQACKPVVLNSIRKVGKPP
jgi:hypothetical protein